jgi:hypothetical protein
MASPVHLCKNELKPCFVFALIRRDNLNSITLMKNGDSLGCRLRIFQKRNLRSEDDSGFGFSLAGCNNQNKHSKQDAQEHRSFHLVELLKGSMIPALLLNPPSIGRRWCHHAGCLSTGKINNYLVRNLQAFWKSLGLSEYCVTMELTMAD